MKKILLLITLCFGWLLSYGQPQSLQADSWKIKWHKRTIVETGKEDEMVNKKTVKKGELDNDYCLEITYKESSPQKEKEWKRSFLLFDENDNELIRKDSTRNVLIPASELKTLFGDKTKIRIYTVTLPTDPNMAASIRVRRVHLATIELK
jgi:hypothetical protein